ncbi:MAG: carboxypeptidase-like regulatory domain-containing protein [Candidatus Eisenbacteria bacterium]
MSDYNIDGYLVHPLLRRDVASSDLSTLGSDDHALVRFPHVVPGDYLLRISIRERNNVTRDVGIVPVLIDGAESATLHVPTGGTSTATIEINTESSIKGRYEGPILPDVDQTLAVYLWEADTYLDTGGDQGSIRSATVNLGEGRDFDIPLFLDRDLIVSWALLSQSRTATPPLWYGGEVAMNATRVRPTDQSEEIVLQGSLIAFDLTVPDAPGKHDGYFELHDESGALASSWRSQEGDGRTTIVFGNLQPKTYFLHYRKQPSSNLHEQWYGTGRTLDMSEATPIDVTSPGSFERFPWTPYVGGSISGTVTLETGEIAGDYWVVYLIGDSDALENGTRTNLDGEFTLVGFEAGSYRVGVARRGTSQITWYPGTTDSDEAEFIQLDDYRQIEGLHIQLVPLGARQGQAP